MATKFHLVSDVHLEFDALQLDLSNVADTVLLIAGDYGQYAKAAHRDYMRTLCESYRHVVYVPGNHCYYGGRIDKVDRMWREFELQHPTFNYLNPGSLVLDDVLIVGACLWTDFGRADPVAMLEAQSKMSDYRYIEIHDPPGVYRKIWPRDVVRINDAHRQFIRQAVEDKPTDVRAVLVITHHSPLVQHVHPKYIRHRHLNLAYHNTGMEEMFDLPIDVWAHGHTHNPIDEQVGSVRVICHPKGYAGHEATATNYQPKAFVL